MKKYLNAAILCLVLLGFAAPMSHAVDLMKDVKHAGHSLEKDFGKMGSGAKKEGHRISSSTKKGFKRLKIHKPKVKL